MMFTTKLLNQIIKQIVITRAKHPWGWTLLHSLISTYTKPAPGNQSQEWTELAANAL